MVHGFGDGCKNWATGKITMLHYMTIWEYTYVHIYLIDVINDLIE